MPPAEDRPEGPSYREVLAEIHRRYQPRNYVEIGVARGDSITLVGPDTVAVGIDPRPRIDKPLPEHATIHAMTSDEYFATHDLRAELGGHHVELAFIDGLHHFEAALRDLANIERHCTTDSVVLVHDWFPHNEKMAGRTPESMFWAGDVWKLALLLQGARPDLSIVTLDATPTGLGLITGLDPTSEVLTDRYDDLVAEHMELPYDVLRHDKRGSLAVTDQIDAELARAFSGLAARR